MARGGNCGCHVCRGQGQEVARPLFGGGAAAPVFGVGLERKEGVPIVLGKANQGAGAAIGGGEGEAAPPGCCPAGLRPLSPPYRPLPPPPTVRFCCSEYRCLRFFRGGPIRRGPGQVPISRIPEGKVKAYLTAISTSPDLECSAGREDPKAHIRFRIVYNSYRDDTGECDPVGEEEMGWVRDQLSDRKRGTDGWFFNEPRRHVSFPLECTTPKVKYRPPTGLPGPAGCTEVEWSWNCDYVCSPRHSLLTGLIGCFSRGTLSIGATYRRRQLPERLYVEWKVEGRSGTCLCDCLAELNLAQTENPDDPPYFGPHLDDADQPAPDPSDCTGDG
jgi:hypothetical protein